MRTRGIPKNPNDRFDDLYLAIPESGCWLWAGKLTAKGYGLFTLCRPKRYVRAHRFSYERYVSQIPIGKMVLHYCDVPSCVNPHHLFIGTAKDNLYDCIKKGRFTNHISRIFTPDDIDCIRSSPKGKITTELAKRFGVHPATIRRIRSGLAKNRAKEIRCQRR